VKEDTIPKQPPSPRKEETGMLMIPKEMRPKSEETSKPRVSRRKETADQVPTVDFPKAQVN
jgi:hypothetical protein